MAQLAGQVALITGAGSGVGRATALALAGAGARVVVAGRTAAHLEETAALIADLPGSGPEQAWAFSCDVTSQPQVQEMIEGIVQRWGRLDIVVNNAGLNVRARALSSLSVEDWRRQIAANLDGAFYCVHAALPSMRTRGSGLFLHIGSLSVRKPGALAGVAYTASKAGLASMSAIINTEERQHGIRSSVITLGDTDTGFVDFRPAPPSSEQRTRYLQPEDVAACILLIATLPPRAGVDELVLTSAFVN